MLDIDLREALGEFMELSFFFFMALFLKNEE